MMLGELRRAPNAVIANGASLSNAIDVGDGGLVTIIMPSSWTAANLTFQASDSENGTYVNVYDSAGTEMTVTAAASRYINLSPATLAGLRFIKIRSGTSGAPVTQLGARTLILLARKLA